MCDCVLASLLGSDSPESYLCLVVVVGIVWPNEPQSYAGGNVGTCRTSHARQVKGNGSDKMECPGPPVCYKGYDFGIAT
jgi:hypothetical protein